MVWEGKWADKHLVEEQAGGMYWQTFESRSTQFKEEGGMGRKWGGMVRLVMEGEQVW